MELLRAQREGREEEFKRQEREKLRERTAARLDAEMDDYFSSRPKKDEPPSENQQTEGGGSEKVDDTANGGENPSDLPPKSPIENTNGAADPQSEEPISNI